MPNLNPIHYLCVALFIVCIVLGITTLILSSKLETAKTINKTTEIIGNVQNAITKKENEKSNKNKEDVNEKYTKSIADLQFANRRLRDSIASSRFLPGATQICTDSSTRTSVDWPLISTAIRDFEEQTRVLIESGDHAIQGLNTVKDWYKEEIN